MILLQLVILGNLGYLGYLVMGSQLRNVAINEELTNES